MNTIPSIKVAIASSFLKQMSMLPRNARKKIDQFVRSFQSNPTSSSLNYEIIRNASDPNFRSVRVDQKYRAIVHKPDQGDVYLLCWVDNHDEAYAWAVRRRCQVHPKTGSLQIYVTEEITEPATTAPDEPASVQPEVLPQEEISTLPIFDKFSDEQLIGLGVPEEQLPLVRAVTNEGQLAQIQENLPEEGYEGLQYLWYDIDYNEVMDVLHPNLNNVQKQEGFDTSDVKAALDRASSKRTFWVAENETQLIEMLDAPLDQWRIFLHPSQRKFVEKHFSGPARVLGGAGTGKTVVAMHRAVHLAKHVFTGPNDRILFTTFTKNLAHDIKNAMENLGSPKEISKIEVMHLHGWVMQFLKKQNYGYTVAYFDDKSGRQLKELWEKALNKVPPLGLSDRFYREEWEQVVQYHGIDDAKLYGRIKRTGRGTQLSKKQRLAIWKVFEEYRNLLEEHNIREHVDAIRDARILLSEKPHLVPFKAVVVDEAQDLSPEAYKLIRALVPEESNDIFVVGDGHQRIYRYKVSLSQCGIKIVGRSHRLRLNYRTTDEIRKYAVQILHNVQVDDLDEGLDNHKGYISLLHGTKPAVQSFTSFTEEVDFIASTLADQSIPHARTCLVARTQDMVDKYIAALSQKGIDTIQIRRSAPSGGEKLRIATMHRVKGLEFDRVIIAGVNDMVMPYKTALSQADDDLAKEAAETTERCLLYVALTRAKKEVFVSSHGVRSSILP